MDDGTIQKRTVSLSTLPDIEDGDEESISDQYRFYNPDMKKYYHSETTPLLIKKNQHQSYPIENDDRRQQQPQYQSTNTTNGTEDGTDSDTSSDDDEDSDSPFFPPSSNQKIASSTAKRASPYHVIDDDQGYTRKEYPWYQYPRSFFNHCINLLQLTPQKQLVLKCSFAYLIGSLFTFIPALNSFIGNNRTSSHLVATATVFFNPAKTLGGMLEASLYGWAFVLFANIICFGSMITTDYFVDNNEFLIAHTISLMFWLAGSTFIVAYLKAHWNKPPVATACSLCFIIIFVIVVREGSANLGDFDTTRIQQIVSAVATGTFITVTCCVVFWPSSAAVKLKKDLDVTLSSYRVLLKLLTKTFLLDDDLPEFKANRTLQTAIVAHRTSFVALQKSLNEAKLEIWNRNVQSHVKEYEEIVKNMERLAQYMGGLRSSCGLQFEIINRGEQQGASSSSPVTTRDGHQQQNKNNKKNIIKRSVTMGLTPPSLSNGLKKTETWNVRAGYRRRKIQDRLKKQKTTASYFDLDQQYPTSNSSPVVDRLGISSHSGEEEEGNHEEINGRHAHLNDYIANIKKPLKSLAYTCKQTIFHLQAHFHTGILLSERTKKTIPSATVLKANLVKAIALFEASQRHILQQPHLTVLQQQQSKSKRKAKNVNDYRASPVNGDNDDDALDEEIFLVYFFVFNMVEFARQLIPLVESVGNLAECEASNRHRWYSVFLPTKHLSADEDDAFTFQNFKPNERNTTNTLHTPEPNTTWRKFFIQTWRAFSRLKEQKIRYAIKSSLAATLMAAPAFFETTGDWFREWRMEWALITLMVVMTPTTGGTNLVSVYRIFSTILGCYAAAIFYVLFPGNMYVLPLLTWLFSLPNFWLILNHKHGKFGQFTLLAYNLVMLNQYNHRESDSSEIWVLAFQRCAAILIGVVFGLIATAYIWPYEARVELRKGLSDLILRLAWMYQKLVAVYSERPMDKVIILKQQDHDGNCTKIMTPEMQRKILSRNFMDLEVGLQRTLLELQTLLSQTPNEPRLKGKFPMATYRNMLDSCQNIIDKFSSIRTVIMKDVWYDDVQMDFILPVSHERHEMAGNILLYFYLLASALILKTPLPPYFPPARQAWKALILRLRQLPSVKKQHLLEKDHAYICYYAYVTMIEDIIRELDKLGQNMTQLFGSIIPQDQWNNLFENWDIEQNTNAPPRIIN
ncbi:unnamed protein product [Cunninghamella echinulata]